MSSVFCRSKRRQIKDLEERVFWLLVARSYDKEAMRNLALMTTNPHITQDILDKHFKTTDGLIANVQPHSPAQANAADGLIQGKG